MAVVAHRVSSLLLFPHTPSVVAQLLLEYLLCFSYRFDMFQDIEMSEAQEGDPKYLAPELMNGQFGKPADIFR